MQSDRSIAFGLFAKGNLVLVQKQAIENVQDRSLQWLC